VYEKSRVILGVAVPEAYGGLGMGFVSTMLVCDYISGATGSFSTAFGAHTGNRYYNFIWY
jgi:alkylation response protein AidB-like acyl-CoA dehydrogenase